MNITPIKLFMSSQSESTTGDNIREDQEIRLMDNLTLRKILIAEDNNDIARLLEIFLSTAGYHVDVVGQGDLAVEAALKGNPDLIVMDLLLPGMDGYSAVEMLREKGFSNPILALTANARSEDRIKCLSMGFDGYMGKPVEREALLKKISSLMHS